MPHLIGRGRYGRETYPSPGAAGAANAGCTLGVGTDSNEGEIDVLSSIAEPFLFPRQQGVQGNPMEVVLPDFTLGDSLFIRYRIDWGYDPNAVVAPSSAEVVTAPVVDLGSGFQLVLQAVGTAPYGGAARIIQDGGLGSESPLIAATDGSLLFTPTAFTALPRVAVACETDVPADPSNPTLVVAEDSGPAHLEVTRIRGGCTFQEPAFALSPPLALEPVPFPP